MVRCSLALLVLPLAMSCSIGNQYRVYGVDLEIRTDARVLLWPSTDDGSRFRFVVERADHPAQSIEIFGLGRELPPALSASDVNGATVLLPPDADIELRRAGRQALDEIEASHPGLSRHLIVTQVDWRDVGSLDALNDRVRSAAEAAHGGDTKPDSFGELYQALAPDLVVLPRAGTDEFLVARAVRRPSMFSAGKSTYEYEATSTAELLAGLETEPSYERVRPYRWMILLVPVDADAETRALCDELAVEAYSSAHSAWALLRRETESVSADDLIGPEVLEAVHQSLVGEAVGIAGAQPAAEAVSGS